MVKETPKKLQPALMLLYIFDHSLLLLLLLMLFTATDVTIYIYIYLIIQRLMETTTRAILNPRQSFCFTCNRSACALSCNPHWCLNFVTIDFAD